MTVDLSAGLETGGPVRPDDAPRGPVTPGPRGRRRGVRNLAQLGFTLPALIWFLVFTLGPLASLFYFATLQWRSLIAPRTFVGFDNFVRLAQDPVFWHAVLNTAVQLAVTLPIMIVSAFCLAYYLNLAPRGHRFIRTLLFTPVLLSASALAMVFIGVFAPSGLINGFLGVVGLEDLARPWLADGTTGMAAIIAVGLWSGTSVSTIMFASRLAAIPGEVFEAAELDGAGHIRRMWSIAWPVSREFVGVVTMLQFLWTLFNSAALVLLLTKGGPGNSTVTLSFLVYDYAFGRAQVGYSQAIAVVLFFVGVIGLLLIRRIFREKGQVVK